MKFILIISLWAGIATADINDITPPYAISAAKVCLNINALVVCRDLTAIEVGRELKDIISRQDKFAKCKKEQREHVKCFEV